MFICRADFLEYAAVKRHCGSLPPAGYFIPTLCVKMGVQVFQLKFIFLEKRGLCILFPIRNLPIWKQGIQWLRYLALINQGASNANCAGYIDFVGIEQNFRFDALWGIAFSVSMGLNAGTNLFCEIFRKIVPCVQYRAIKAQISTS